MKRQQAGFTMIELIVVIVILGVLAATALPKFISVQENAESSSVAGVAGSMASAMSVNYGGCLVTNNVVTAGKCVKVDSCAGTDGVANLLQGGIPAGYTVAATTGGTEPSANGTVASCTVTKTGTSPLKTATFDGIGAGN